MPIDAVTSQRVTSHLVDKKIPVQQLAESEELQKTVSGDLGLTDGILKDYVLDVLNDQGTAAGNFQARQKLIEAGLLILPKAEPESTSETPAAPAGTEAASGAAVPKTDQINKTVELKKQSDGKYKAESVNLGKVQVADDKKKGTKDGISYEFATDTNGITTLTVTSDNKIEGTKKIIEGLDVKQTVKEGDVEKVTDAKLNIEVKSSENGDGGKWNWKDYTRWGIFGVSIIAALGGMAKWEESAGKGATALGVIGALVTGFWTFISGWFGKEDDVNKPKGNGNAP